MADKLERFGKYLILDHLVDGGMAKICRARFLGEKAYKLVAIKMIQPQFSKDVNFQTMFEDELSIAMKLVHPNIGQTYEYGKYREQLYNVMEYIYGNNLKQVLDRLKEKSAAFPVEVCVHIIAQVCQGLDYAHKFKDQLTGKELKLVHRDISPHNIMVSFDGSVKVIDFGIAKAETNSESTQAGTIKGKLSYLAPEYLEGLSLDHRYDQFAVGITLWELLCGRKLFHANNDLAVLKLIQACKVPPPSSINPNVPKELDAICLKALSKDRNNRYEDMDKLNRALTKFLYLKYSNFNPSDLSFFLNDLFKTEKDRDDAKFLEYGKIDIVPYLKDIDQEALSGTNGPATPTSEPKLQPAQRREIEFAPNDATATLNIEVENKISPAARTERTSTAIRRSTITSSNTAKTGNKTNTTINRNQKMAEVQKEEEKKSSAKILIILVASVAGFAFFQPELVHELTGIDLPSMLGKENSRGPSSEQTEVAAPVAPVKKKLGGILTLSGLDPYMEVFINGEKISYSGVGHEVLLNREIELKIEKHNHETFVTKFTATKDDPNKAIEIPVLQKMFYGVVSSSHNYTEGSILKFKINGSEVEKRLPFDNYRVPAGKYEGIIKDPLLGTEKTINFEVEEDKKMMIE